jgi:hypothetical protein
VDELESLHQLHQSGALTSDEFSQAKSRLLSLNSPQNNTILAFAEILPEEAERENSNENGEEVKDEKTRLLEIV